MHDQTRATCFVDPFVLALAKEVQIEFAKCGREFVRSCGNHFALADARTCDVWCFFADHQIVCRPLKRALRFSRVVGPRVPLRFASPGATFCRLASQTRWIASTSCFNANSWATCCLLRRLVTSPTFLCLKSSAARRIVRKYPRRFLSRIDCSRLPPGSARSVPALKANPTVPLSR